MSSTTPRCTENRSDIPLRRPAWILTVSYRVGRSLQHLLGFLGELKAKGVDLYLHQQGLDTRTPAGKAMLQMLGVSAESERAMIVERVHAGLRRAKAQGRRLGRPRVTADVEQQHPTRADEGHGHQGG